MHKWHICTANRVLGLLQVPCLAICSKPSSLMQELTICGKQLS